jgi:hypothetical protein
MNIPYALAILDGISLHMITIGERDTYVVISIYIYDRFCHVHIRLALHMDGSTVDLPVYLDLMHLCRDCKHTVAGHASNIGMYEFSNGNDFFLVQTR